jgi:hypothetical protein
MLIFDGPEKLSIFPHRVDFETNLPGRFTGWWIPQPPEHDRFPGMVWVPGLGAGENPGDGDQLIAAYFGPFKVVHGTVETMDEAGAEIGKHALGEIELYLPGAPESLRLLKGGYVLIPAEGDGTHTRMRGSDYFVALSYPEGGLQVKAGEALSLPLHHESTPAGEVSVIFSSFNGPLPGGAHYGRVIGERDGHLLLHPTNHLPRVGELFAGFWSETIALELQQFSP